MNWLSRIMAEIKKWTQASAAEKGAKLKSALWSGVQTQAAAAEKVQFERIFTPHSSWYYLAYGILMISLSGISTVLGHWGAIVGVPFVAVLFFVIWIQDRRRSKRLTYQFVKERPRGAKGLILLLSPFSPRNKSLQDPQLMLPLLESILQKDPSQLNEADFTNVDVAHSNLRPLIDAVAFHADKEKTLREVWLITSESEVAESGGTTLRGPGSERAGDLLERYLCFKFGPRVDVHRKGPKGENLCVKPWDYGAVCQIAESIFRYSGNTEDVVLGDVTGGNKMMSVALAIACVPRTRKMQYMDAMRDWQGHPVESGTTEPLVIDIDPIIYRSQ